MERYVLSIDQSTQGTKALLFDHQGRLICRTDLPHRQIINDQGWVSHDPEEIMKNITLACIRSTVTDYPVDEVITTGKSQIQAEVKEKLTKALGEQNIGLQMINLTIQDAEPPTR